MSIARPLDVRWIHGSESAKHNTDPDIQVFWYDADTVILRQNMAINYEGPFLYLLFGTSRVALLDTGATAAPELFPLREVVDGLIAAWLERHPQAGPEYELLVLHTHGHGDHIAADHQFESRAQTVLVDPAREAVWDRFGFTADPDAVQPLELGDRTLEVLATPGHHPAALTFYDPATGFLLTGDTVYRGRLYIDDLPAFTRTIDRLIAFAADRPITHVLGCHIEMTIHPGIDYPVRTTYQPEEPPLEMTPDHLQAVRAALDEMGPTPARVVRDDFILWPLH